MEQKRNADKFGNKSLEKWPLGKPRMRWENDFTYHSEVGCGRGGGSGSYVMADYSINSAELYCQKVG
jgi:hypothetical protein